MVGSFQKREILEPSPEIELIACGPAVKALEEMTPQMNREASVLADAGRIVEGTRTAQLVASSGCRLEVYQLENPFHRNGSF